MPILAAICVALPGALPGLAEQHACKEMAVEVSSGDRTTNREVCKAARIASKLFASCALPDLLRVVQLELVETLPEGCNAQYHCGESRVEVLTPSAMSHHRSKNGAFSFVDDEVFFRSVVVHELAHAVMDPVPCPFDDCIVADEYIAYAMQVMSLPPSLQEKFGESPDAGQPISRDALSELMLFMSPDGFAQDVWAHLRQRPDACEYIGKVATRDILLDRERFDSD
ncbi:DUF6639 family protein [Aliiroseovarius sp. S253]|uniref:DUF6639 family protein n=1 Tax=Aliiroseovarius sp. S253 TaxID=3415133 RepID=UPI003C7AC3E4